MGRSRAAADLPHPDSRPTIVPEPPEDAGSELGTEATLVLFQPFYERRLTAEDARQIAENMVGFFRLLIAWDAAASSAGEDTESEFRRAA